MSIPVSRDLELQAVRNLASGIYSSARIPDRVLALQYREIYVTDIRHLFSRDTVTLFKLLMGVEGAQTVGVGCFQQSKVAMPDQQGQTTEWRDDVFFLSADTEDDAYWSFLRRNWSDYGQQKATREMRPPWSIFAEIVGACTELGGWYIYAEKFAEIALIGFKESPGAFVERRLYSEFGIERLADALKRDTFFGVPSNEYSKQQRAVLRAAYLPKGDEPQLNNLAE
jgi:hypothetical protein